MVWWTEAGSLKTGGKGAQGFWWSTWVSHADVFANEVHLEALKANRSHLHLPTWWLVTGPPSEDNYPVLLVQHSVAPYPPPLLLLWGEGGRDKESGAYPRWVLDPRPTRPFPATRSWVCLRKSSPQSRWGQERPVLKRVHCAFCNASHTVVASRPTVQDTRTIPPASVQQLMDWTFLQQWIHPCHQTHKYEVQWVAGR